MFHVAPGQERHITLEDLKAFLSDYPTAHVPQRAESSSVPRNAVDFSVASVCFELDIDYDVVDCVRCYDHVRLSW